MVKTPTVLLSLLLAAMAGSCNYRAIVTSRDGSGDNPGAAAKPPIDSVYLLGGEDKLPDSSILLADMTLYSPLTWPNSFDLRPYHLMLERARKEVRDMGGNAFQILDFSAGKFARERMVARIYLLRQPPVSLPVPADSCIVHIKSEYAADGPQPVAIYFNDSLVAVARGSDRVGRRHIDFGAFRQQQVEQFTFKFGKGGLLDLREKMIQNPHWVTLEKGREYYLFIRYVTPKAWREHYFSRVTKESFEIDQYRLAP